MITPAVTISKTSLITKILYQPLFNVLMLLYVYIPGHDLGLAIIGLTLIIRLILYPSYAQTLRAQQQLKNIQPEIDRVKDLHKEDKAKQSQELMQVYKDNKVNPLGSCLPMIIQLPILYALYRVFMVGLNIDSLDLLYSWFPRVPTTINNIFLGFTGITFLQIDLAAPNVYLAVIAGLAQFLQSWLMSKFNPIGQGGGTAKIINMQMMYLFPVITVMIGLSLPAALALYWVATTVFTVIQQIIVMYQFKSQTNGAGS